MKARDISTGKIVEVYESCNEDFPWTDDIGDKVWKTEELIFFETTEKNFDYWTRLEHTYAGMAMQGICSSDIIMERINRINTEADKFGVLIAELSANLAHALVEKMKEERK